MQVKPARAQVRTRPAKAAGSRRRMSTPYEERTLEELQERAKELGIEGRASMTKDELITALRTQRTSSRRPAAPGQAKPERATEPAGAKAPQTGPYEERTVEELRERAEGGRDRGSRLDDQGRADREPSRPALAAPQHDDGPGRAHPAGTFAWPLSWAFPVGGNGIEPPTLRFSAGCDLSGGVRLDSPESRSP